MKNFFTRLITYLKDSKTELTKVIFPLGVQVKSAFIAVITVVTVITLFLALVDLLMYSGVFSIVVG
ncbi:MAG: preprotein translocase subunit SecE [Helicobacteraceae bacterium]|jgi:preprotein translocase subunit SecE|nr:preprotein translocase subunit SecE [Helicobacteraceae bacterium]